MSEKAPSQEKSPFNLLNAEWLKKSREKIKNSRAFPIASAVTATGLGVAALIALGWATPFAIMLGGGAAMYAGIKDTKGKSTDKKPTEKKSEEKKPAEKK